MRKRRPKYTKTPDVQPRSIMQSSRTQVTGWPMAANAGDFEIYQADIEHPKDAALTFYRQDFGWLTITCSNGSKTTVFINLSVEGDRQFSERLYKTAGVLAILAADYDEGRAEATVTSTAKQRSGQSRRK